MGETELKSSSWWTVLITVITVLGGTGWWQFYLERQDSLKRENQRVVVEYLQPIQRYIEDNEAIYEELTGSEYSEPNVGGVLETYLFRIRRDGVSSHPVMRERINTLVKNNNHIVALLQSYQGHTFTEQFSRESDKFREHAQRYNDRWNAMLDIYKDETKRAQACAPISTEFPKCPWGRNICAPGTLMEL